jgi:CubicO group peptidase (beta-lactamase class C family)
MPRKIILNKMKSVRHVSTIMALAIYALFLTAWPLASQSAPKETAQRTALGEFQRFGEDLEIIRAELKVPGMAAAVVRDGKIVWRRNYGEADAASHAPVTDQALFPIASISKTMAAAVMMQLVNDGKVKLSDPITKYRAELPFPPTITIERIMSHTAEGIPGEEFLYSGALYGLLTGVIERVEHKPYAEVLNERIFHPLQLNDTFAGLPADKSAPNTKSVASRIATGYQLDPQTHEAAPLSIDLSRISTATGVISDIGDLVKYAVALDGDKLLPRATMELISTPQRSTRGGTLPYGLGWFAEEYLGEQIVWHYGQERNYSSLFVRVPSRHLTFIMLANSVALSDAPRLSDGELARSPAALAFLADVALAVNPESAITPSEAIASLRGETLRSVPANTPQNQSVRLLARDALVAQLRIESYLGHSEKSAALMTQCVDQFPGLGLPRETATLFYLVQLHSAELRDVMMEVAHALVEVHPTLAPALYVAGVAEQQSGHDDKAQDLWKRACNQWPHTEHWSVGNSCLEAGRGYVENNEKLARLYLGRAIEAAADDETSAAARKLLAKLGDTPQ